MELLKDAYCQNIFSGTKDEVKGMVVSVYVTALFVLDTKTIWQDFDVRDSSPGSMIVHVKSTNSSDFLPNAL